MNENDIFEVDLPEGIEVISDYGDVQLRMDFKDLKKLGKDLMKIYNEVQTEKYRKINEEHLNEN